MIQASDVWQIAAAVIAAFGGSTLILLVGSSWLGKVWASRILEKDRAHFQKELDELQRKADRELVDVQKQLDVLKNTELRVHSDKLIIYRAAIDIIAAMLLTLTKYGENRLAREEGRTELDTFEKARLQLYGYLGMLAPQDVMDAQDLLMDYLLEVIHGESASDWVRMRGLALDLINAIRRDIGIDKSPIEYRGTR